MKCAICDATLGEEEVRFNREHDEWDPCGVCKEIISEVFGQEDDSVNDIVLGDYVPDEPVGVAGHD